MNMTWTTKEITVATFCTMLNPISKEQVDCDPVGQRPDVESLPKRQGIIDTVIRGYDFGELKLRTLLGGEYMYRSIDGGHRKRAIRDFVGNKFKTNKGTVCYIDGVEVQVGNMFYKDLPIRVKEMVLAYKMRFTIYGANMTDEQAGEIFRRTNITTDVNHQEMLNSYEDNSVAKFIRETSRPIRGVNNEYHDLFEYYYTKKDERKQSWFQAISTRLRDDEYVTRFLALLTKPKNDPNWLSVSKRDSEECFIKLGDKTTGLWVNSPAEAKKHQKMVIDALDFMLQYAKAKKAKSKQTLSSQEYAIVSRLYVYLIRTYGRKGFKVNDWEDFYVSVRGALDRFVAKGKGKDTSNLRLDLCTDDKGTRAVYTAFCGYLQVHDKQQKSIQSLNWFLEEMDINNCGIVFLDSVRVFSQEMIEQVLREQGYKCWVTGEPLKITDAVGGHILAHSVGGRTTKDNCMVCLKSENTRMGAMDAVLYRQIRRDELKLAA